MKTDLARNVLFENIAIVSVNFQASKCENLPRCRGPAPRLLNVYLIFRLKKHLQYTKRSMQFHLNDTILYQERREGHLYFSVYRTMPLSGCARKMMQVIDGLNEMFLQEKTTAPSRRNFFHGTVLELKKSPGSLLLELSRLQGFLPVAHLFGTSQGQREKGYVNILLLPPPDQSYPSLLPDQTKPDLLLLVKILSLTQVLLLNLYTLGYLSYKQSSVFIKSLKFIFLKKPDES